MSLYCASFTTHNISFNARWKNDELVSLAIGPCESAHDTYGAPPHHCAIGPEDPRMAALLAWLDAWYRGDTPAALPLAFEGTAFQVDVWTALQRVPRGRTISYRDLAREAGHPKAVRAAANACGANPLIILVPCHRVVRTDGSLGGFSAGLEYKERFLSIEGWCGAGVRTA